MRTVLNLAWVVLVGWWLALGFAIAAVLSAITIIGIPFAIASFRLASYALWPFGRTVVFRSDAGVFSLLGNVVWLILGGVGLTLSLVSAGLVLCVTIIGIPFGVACFKMVPLALMPLGRQIVPADRAWLPGTGGYGAAA